MVEWNFNAFKVSVSGCNGRRRLCRLWEGKGLAQVALELAWKRWLDGAAVGQHTAVVGGGNVNDCPRKRMSSTGSAGQKMPS
jgi:hypothetical protein